MKEKILKLSAVFLLLLFMGASCQKDEIEFADESIVVSNQPPGISIYKTRGDYLDKIFVQITEDGNISFIPTLNIEDDLNYVTDRKGNIKAKNRRLLKNGYIVGGGRLSGAYTDITFNEYVAYKKKHNLSAWPLELVKSRIIDYDPYIEYYGSVCFGIDCSVQEFTLGEIYKMLENGTIEEYFTRYK